MAEREPSSDTSGDINMSATNPPPHKRKLSQPNVDISVEVKKQKLTESDTNTIPSKTPAKEKDTVKDNLKELSKDDLKSPKRTATGKVKPTTSAKPGAAGTLSTVKPTNVSEEFPNGHLYCHQCNKKRDASRESCPLPIYFQP